MRKRTPIAAAVLAATLAALLLTGAASAASQEEEGTVNPWSFELAPYVWIPEVHGAITVRDVSANLNVTFDKIFDLLGAGDLFAAGGHAEVRYDRFSFFLDAFGGTARPSSDVTVGRVVQRSGKADVTTNWAFFEFGPTYRVLKWPTGGPGRPITVDALVGGRLMYFYDSISLTGDAGIFSRFASASSTWVDPFVGGRFAVPVWGDLDVVFRGDIGGFGAGSQLAWNLIGGFQYLLPWEPGGAQTSLVAIYKALDFDYEGTSGQNRAALDFRGPALGLAFRF